jgi:hypothetical protein
LKTIDKTVTNFEQRQIKRNHVWGLKNSRDFCAIL